jgi:hypothetical protein
MAIRHRANALVHVAEGRARLQTTRRPPVPFARNQRCGALRRVGGAIVGRWGDRGSRGALACGRVAALHGQQGPFASLQDLVEDLHRGGHERARYGRGALRAWPEADRLLRSGRPVRVQDGHPEARGPVVDVHQHVLGNPDTTSSTSPIRRGGRWCATSCSIFGRHS